MHPLSLLGNPLRLLHLPHTLMHTLHPPLYLLRGSDVTRPVTNPETTVYS
jgi:hypothetical protein